MDSPSDVWNLSLAAKYLDKSFNAFEKKSTRASTAIRNPRLDQQRD
jgi:hypothetical protein